LVLRIAVEDGGAWLSSQLRKRITRALASAEKSPGFVQLTLRENRT
jgi:hypothetical protein